MLVGRDQRPTLLVVAGLCLGSAEQVYFAHLALHAAVLGLSASQTSTPQSSSSVVPSATRIVASEKTYARCFVSSAGLFFVRSAMDTVVFWVPLACYRQYYLSHPLGRPQRRPLLSSALIGIPLPCDTSSSIGFPLLPSPPSP